MTTFCCKNTTIHAEFGKKQILHIPRLRRFTKTIFIDHFFSLEIGNSLLDIGHSHSLFLLSAILHRSFFSSITSLHPPSVFSIRYPASDTQRRSFLSAISPFIHHRLSYASSVIPQNASAFQKRRSRVTCRILCFLKFCICLKLWANQGEILCT